jgi:hypothetical protein
VQIHAFNTSPERNEEGEREREREIVQILLSLRTFTGIHIYCCLKNHQTTF